jgi:hypothetical protein
VNIMRALSATATAEAYRTIVARGRKRLGGGTRLSGRRLLSAFRDVARHENQRPSHHSGADSPHRPHDQAEFALAPSPTSS